MQQLLETVVASTIIFPFIAFFVSFLLLKFIMVEKRQALQWSAEITSIFLMLAVYFAVKSIFHLQLAWLIILILILFLGLASFYQYNRKNEIDFLKVGHLALRACFLFYTLVYFLVLLIGLVIRVVGAL